MFVQSAYSGGARARYQAVDFASLVEGATAHGLISIMFDQLMAAIDTMAAAQRSGNRAKMIELQAKACTILIGLETSLDYEKGGELAINLALVYREGRRLLRQGCNASDPQVISQARDMLFEIVDAWRQINPAD